VFSFKLDLDLFFSIDLLYRLPYPLEEGMTESLIDRDSEVGVEYKDLV